MVVQHTYRYDYFNLQFLEKENSGAVPLCRNCIKYGQCDVRFYLLPFDKQKLLKKWLKQ